MKSSAKAKALIAALGSSLSQDLMQFAASEAAFRRTSGSMTKKDFETLLERLKKLGYDPGAPPPEPKAEPMFHVRARCRMCNVVLIVSGGLTLEQARRIALHGVGAFSKLHLDCMTTDAERAWPCYGSLDVIGLHSA